MKNNQTILAISGEKNAGKTTLIESLLPFLTQAGLKVAVIKHDGHSFSPDVPNTDTYRHLQAGAYGTAIFDGEKAMLVKQGHIEETYLMAQFPEADLILLEGFKHSQYPKIEVVTSSLHCDPKTLLAIVSDVIQHHATIPVFPRDDIETMGNYLLSYIAISPNKQESMSCDPKGGISHA